MNAFFDYLVTKVILASSTVSYYGLSLATVIIFTVLSLGCITIRTVIYGRPAISFKLLSAAFFVCGALSFLGGVDVYNKGAFFKTLYGPLWMFIINFVAITVLYAGFYHFAVLHVTAKRLLKGEATALLSTPVARIDEVPLYFEEDRDPVAIATQKLGSVKPRLDDKIDFFKVESIIKGLYKRELSPIDRATVEFCERTVRHGKNAIMTERLRRDLNEAFAELIKICARY